MHDVGKKLTSLLLFYQRAEDQDGFSCTFLPFICRADFKLLLLLTDCHLFGRQNDRKEREIYLLVAHFPDACSDWGWVM